MARKSKVEKALDLAVDKAFKKYGQNVQFNVMILGTVLNDLRTALVEGKDMDQVGPLIVAKHRVKL